MVRRPAQAANEQIWPSLERQLLDAKAIPGSALEKFIKDNQNFSLLRPEEANDRLGLPPWIRVYWRRLHPELQYSGADPTGGYPLNLKDTLRGMLKDQEWPARIPQPK